MPPYVGVKFTVNLIEKVQNARLKEQFCRSWQHFADRNYPTEVVRMYHGTDVRNIPSILQNNLLMTKTGDRDPGWFGAGLYFSTHADYVFMYSNNLAPVKPGHKGKILVFNTLPGRKNSCTNLRMGHERTDETDSSVSPNGYEHVMFDSRHVLPTHVISFSAEVAPGAKYDASVERLGPKHAAQSEPAPWGVLCPASPTYSPASPVGVGHVSPAYSPTSPTGEDVPVLPGI
jgi:hypothetical protein